MAVLTDIADAVAAELNGQVFNPPFVAERRFVPLFRLDEGALDTLQVSVVPKGQSFAAMNRAAMQVEYAVDVAVQQRLGADSSADETTIGTLLGLVQDVLDWLRPNAALGRTGRLAGLPEVWFVSIANVPVYAPEHVREKRVFTSVLTVNYRMAR